MFCKKGVLRNFAKFTGVSCEFYETSKNTFFHRTPPVAASDIMYFYWKSDWTKRFSRHFALLQIFFQVSQFQLHFSLVVKRITKRDKNQNKNYVREFTLFLPDLFSGLFITKIKKQHNKNTLTGPTNCKKTTRHQFPNQEFFSKIRLCHFSTFIDP